MRPTRLIRSMVAALAILGSACSSADPATPGSGGSPGGSGGAATSTGGTPGTGGARGSGGAPGTGGTAQPGSGGATSTGGSSGSGSGGKATGGGPGSGTGGMTATGGATAGAGGRSASGAGGRVGSGGAGGSAAGGSSGGGGAGEMSAGCTKTRTLQNGTITITVGGASRKYILKVPDGYDSSHPYRLVLAFAESGSSASSVASRNYFTLATMDTKNTIFAAPDAVGSTGSWSKTDVAFTDAVIAQIEGDLCVDKSRLFATGFSFGGGMAMALACTRAEVFRAVAFFSGADLTMSCPSMLTTPIAYYASQASEDSMGMTATSPITGEVKQAQFAALNGCMPESASTTFPSSGQPHKCTNYKGCSAGHPTEYCVFNGPHGWEPKDPGQSTSWDAPEAWKFITQF
jgi:poly(3-hydroxybutyrate) depolymerase